MVLNLDKKSGIIFWNDFGGLTFFSCGGAMKLLNLLMWVVQFGFSILFPTVFFLILGAWLQDKFDLVSGS